MADSKKTGRNNRLELSVPKVTSRMPPDVAASLDRLESKKQQDSSEELMVLGLKIPLAWHRALSELCLDMTNDHPDYNRFSQHRRGRSVTKAGIVNTLIEEYLQQQKKL